MYNVQCCIVYSIHVRSYDASACLHTHIELNDDMTAQVKVHE